MSCASCHADPYGQAVGGCRDCGSGSDVPSPNGTSYRPVAGRIRDPRVLARAAQGLLALCVVLPLAEAAAGSAAASPKSASFGLGELLFLAAAAVFISWFVRCRANAQLLAPDPRRLAEGWALGAWFVPLLMWWYPHRITRDIWRANGSAEGEWLVHAWWAAWLGKSLGGIIAVEFGLGLAWLRVYEPVANTVAGVLAILLVQRVTAPQSRLAAERSAHPFRARNSVA